LIESAKESLNIETYSLSQTTLEQVFLSFAKEQVQQNEGDVVIQNEVVPPLDTYIPGLTEIKVDNNNNDFVKEKPLLVKENSQNEKVEDQNKF
jgi:hypothetical protein